MEAEINGHLWAALVRQKYAERPAALASIRESIDREVARLRKPRITIAPPTREIPE